MLVEDFGDDHDVRPRLMMTNKHEYADDDVRPETCQSSWLVGELQPSREFLF